MLTRDNLISWYQRLDVSGQAQSLMDHVRSSAPTRRVGGGHGNVTGRYPSRKMGLTIQFESHRVELAAIYEMEYDADVVEYWDQPPSIKLHYRSPVGRQMGVLHTPDFFVIRQNSAGWEEWKTEEELRKLAEHNPNRYCRADTGQWRSPPGEEHASAFSLYYRVRSSREIDWVFQRNVQFLEDYLRTDPTTIPSRIRETALAHAAAAPGLSLDELFSRTKEAISRDQIYWLIAAGVLSANLHEFPLIEPTKVAMFPSPEAALAQTEGQAPHPQEPAPASVVLVVGSSFSWDGKTWKIVNVGDRDISTLSDGGTLVELPLQAFETLVKAGKVTILTTQGVERDSRLTEYVSRASEDDLKIANYRCELVSEYLRGELPLTNQIVPRRTLCRWTARYRRAQTAHGWGYIGLLPGLSRRGNGTAKLPEASQRLLMQFIDRDYESPKQKTKYAVWAALKLACESQGLVVPSYKTFCRAARQRQTFTQVLKRQGRRAAYRVEPFFWDLEQKTPRHGDRPFEVVHLDHTQVDLELACSTTAQPLGRPWLTLVTDTFSRRILAFYLTFDPPSYRSCMMALRECVRRHSRLPQILVTDGGREFESTYFETLLARYECIKKTRPPAKARFGSVCERLFSTTNTQFFHNLEGNTQIMRNVRQVTKSVDPKRRATWTLEKLHEHLSQYFYEVYDTIKHPALGQSPREAYLAGLEQAGGRLNRMVAYDHEFLMSTLPTTRKGKAKVSPGRGAKVNHVYYWSDEFRDPEVERQSIAIRFDPFDAGTVYAFLRGRWVECHSEYYAVFRGRSEKEMMLASQELHRIHKLLSAEFKFTSRKLAEFLQSTESTEALLIQRLRDRENSSLRATFSPGSGTRLSEDGPEPPPISTATAEPAHNSDEVDEVFGEF